MNTTHNRIQTESLEITEAGGVKAHRFVNFNGAYAASDGDAGFTLRGFETAGKAVAMIGHTVFTDTGRITVQFSGSNTGQIAGATTRAPWRVSSCRLHCEAPAGDA